MQRRTQISPQSTSYNLSSSTQKSRGDYGLQFIYFIFILSGCSSEKQSFPVAMESDKIMGHVNRLQKPWLVIVV